MTDDHVEARLRDWFRSEAGEARVPITLAADVDGIPASVSSPRWKLPTWLTRRPAITLVAATATVFVVAVGLRFDPSDSIAGGMASPSAAASPPSVVDSPSPDSIPGSQIVGPATYELPWPGGPAGARVQFAIPTGEAVWASGSTITVSDDRLAPRLDDAGSAPDLGIHDVSGVVDEVCASSDPSRHLVVVGPTTDDLVAALEAQRGWTGRTGPVDVTVAGYPARKFTFDLDVDPGAGCADPAEGVMLWQDRDGTSFILLEGPHQGTATVWIVDVDGHRLVLTATDYLELSTGQQRATRDAILASLEISLGPQLAPATRPLDPGPLDLAWPGGPSGARVQVVIPAGGRFALVDSTLYVEAMGGAFVSGDGTEVEITVHDVSAAVDPVCAHSDPGLALTEVGPSVDDLVTALASQTGWPDRLGPAATIVDGHPARTFELSLDFDLPNGCPDPAEGVMLWREADGAAFAPLEGRRGIVTVWIVDVRGGRFVLTSVDHVDLTTPGTRALVQMILESLTISVPG